MARAVYFTLLTGAALWCLAIVAAPVLHSGVIYAFFSVICHQQVSRSWLIAGEPLAVCIRCASIYLGFLAGLMALKDPRTRLLQAGLILSAAEFALAVLVVDSPLLRALTGAITGFAAAPFIRLGVEQMFMREVRDSM